jgi:lactate dehydrogenase-like 2-hydroxyacid dehydrogenase
MNKFNQIVPINVLNLPAFAEEEVRKYSKLPVNFISDEMNENEVVKAIGTADAVLGSWNCRINSKILDQCPNIKYIGICGTSVINIDVDEVQRRGIVLKNVTDYGDEATAEFVFAQLLNLCRGFGRYQWQDQPTELHGKIIGIIGLGAVGKQIARLALGFNMTVYYHSRTRSPEWEKKGLIYKDKEELLSSSDVISLSVPRNLLVITQKEFSLIRSGAVFVNTSIGKVFELDSFKEWIKLGNNYAIFDNQEYIDQVKDLPTVIALPITAGKTQESVDRLGRKVIQNIKDFLVR